MYLAQKGKKFEFLRARLGVNPHRGTPNFVRFGLFSISNHSENLIHLATMV